jgi:hypothetical protein
VDCGSVSAGGRPYTYHGTGRKAVAAMTWATTSEAFGSADESFGFRGMHLRLYA